VRSCLGRFAVTNAENSYDYAGQDPINGYDLSGLVYQASQEGNPEGTAYSRTVQTCESSLADVAYKACSELPAFYGDGPGVVDAAVHSVKQFGKGIDRKPREFTAGVVATVTGTVILGIAGIGDYFCEEGTAGLGSLACFYAGTKAKAAGLTALAIGGREFSIVWRAGADPRRRR
jgi:hypothetical protein